MQLVTWFPDWKGFKYTNFKETPLATIYHWSLLLGFIELRKWNHVS